MANPNFFWTFQQILDLKHYLVKQGLTIAQIVNKNLFQRNYQAIYAKAQKHGFIQGQNPVQIEIPPKHISRVALAYCAGFIAADATVYQYGRIWMTIHEKDRCILEFLAQQFQIDLNEIRVVKNRTQVSLAIPKEKGKWLIDRFQIHSLKSFGWGCQFPHLPLEEQKAYILGILDADGSISESGTVQFQSNSRSFLEQIKAFAQSHGFDINSKVYGPQKNCVKEGQTADGFVYYNTFPNFSLHTNSRAIRDFVRWCAEPPVWDQIPHIERKAKRVLDWQEDKVPATGWTRQMDQDLIDLATSNPELLPRDIRNQLFPKRSIKSVRERMDTLQIRVKQDQKSLYWSQEEIELLIEKRKEGFTMKQIADQLNQFNSNNSRNVTRTDKSVNWKLQDLKKKSRQKS